MESAAEVAMARNAAQFHFGFTMEVPPGSFRLPGAPRSRKCSAGEFLL